MDHESDSLDCIYYIYGVNDEISDIDDIPDWHSIPHPVKDVPFVHVVLDDDFEPDYDAYIAL